MNDVHIDNGALEKMFADPHGPVGKALTQAAIRVENRAKRLCPVDNGLLRSSISHIARPMRLEGGHLVAYVGTLVEYAIFVEFGTGIYNTKPGAPRTRIVPTHAKALAFRAGGQNVVVKSVAGMHPHPFLRPALKAEAIESRVR